MPIRPGTSASGAPRHSHHAWLGRPVAATTQAWQVNLRVIFKLSPSHEVLQPCKKYKTKYIYLVASAHSSSKIACRLKVEITDERIDIERLKVRETINFYSDLVLFEDELHDSGCSMLGVKIVGSQFSSHLYHYCYY